MIDDQQRYEDRLRIRYFEDAAFRAKADAIHHARLMAGPACMQCMKIADQKQRLNETPQTNS